MHWCRCGDIVRDSPVVHDDDIDRHDGGRQQGTPELRLKSQALSRSASDERVPELRAQRRLRERDTRPPQMRSIYQLKGHLIEVDRARSRDDDVEWLDYWRARGTQERR